MAARITEGESALLGIMLESFLLPGRQDLVPGRSTQLRYGQSITDACIGWDQTAEILVALDAGPRLLAHIPQADDAGAPARGDRVRLRHQIGDGHSLLIAEVLR